MNPGGPYGSLAVSGKAAHGASKVYMQPASEGTAFKIAVAMARRPGSCWCAITYWPSVNGSPTPVQRRQDLQGLKSMQSSLKSVKAAKRGKTVEDIVGEACPWLTAQLK